jgi:hypothetical protein
MIDFDKWRRLSIPTKPDGDYIPFAHIMEDEYAYIIHHHKLFITADPVELSMAIINDENDHISKVKNTVKELFREDRRLQAEYKRSNNDKDFYKY